jgi:hypothetical protein
MGYVYLARPIFVDQLHLLDASRRAGSARVSVALPEFYMAKGRFLRPSPRPAHSAATDLTGQGQAEYVEIT